MTLYSHNQELSCLGLNSLQLHLTQFRALISIQTLIRQCFTATAPLLAIPAHNWHLNCNIKGMMRIFNSQRQLLQTANLRCLTMMLIFGIFAHNLAGCTDKKQGYPKAGEVFPLSVLNQARNLADNKVDLRNKTLLINFWATWCAPCRKEMPDLQKLSEALDPGHFAVIGVSVDKDVNLVKEFLLQHKIGFANFQDEDFEIATQLLGIEAFPETFIVAPDGVIVKRISGERAWNADFFEKLLDGSQRADTTSTVGHVFG